MRGGLWGFSLVLLLLFCYFWAIKTPAMKKHLFSPVSLIVGLLLVGLLFLNGGRAYAQGRVYNPVTDKIELNHEFRGAWLTTVRGSDWPRKIKIEMKRKPGESARDMKRRIEMQRDSQKQALVDVITQIHNTGCNVVIMQLCCNSETYYRSSILPWDHNLTGVQGEDPGYDPLELAIKTAHSLGMEIHGWFNPMRIGGVDYNRVKDHLCYRKPERVITYGKVMYWNPGNPEVVQYLYDLINEVMTNYDLDGAHIDDFFYPDGLRVKTEKIPELKEQLDMEMNRQDGKPRDKQRIDAIKKEIKKLSDNKVWKDDAYFAKYGNGRTLGEWRESNVNALVAAMHRAVHDAKPNAVFGVSPGGRLVNTQRLYADPQHWIEEGSIDYLAPQIYWQHGHQIADFKQVLDSWEPIMKEVPTLPGLAAYRFKEKGFESMEEFGLQVKECREAGFVYGNIWFTTHSLFKPEFMTYLMTEIYPYRSLTPTLGTSTYPAPNAPVVSEHSGTLRWDDVHGAQQYAVYELELKKDAQRMLGDVWKANMVALTKQCKFKKTTKGKNYLVVAVRGKMRSNASNVVFVK